MPRRSRSPRLEPWGVVTSPRRYSRRSAAYARTDQLFRASNCSTERNTVALTAGTHSFSFECMVPLLHLMLMNEDGQAGQSEDCIKAYFAFRTRFVSLARALGVSLWELEHIVTWKGQQNLGEQAARKMTRSASLFEGKDIAVYPETRDTISIEGEEEYQWQKSEQERSAVRQ